MGGEQGNHSVRKMLRTCMNLDETAEAVAGEDADAEYEDARVVVGGEDEDVDEVAAVAAEVDEGGAVGAEGAAAASAAGAVATARRGMRLLRH